MVMMTAKVNKKRAILVLAALAALIVLICILAKGGGTENPAAPQEQPVSVATNDARVQYLTDYGWEVVHSPVQTQQVRIPSEVTDVYDRYNALQMSQGFNLTDYAGKTATRYVYEIKNYPNASDPVYATLLVYRIRSSEPTSPTPRPMAWSRAWKCPADYSQIASTGSPKPLA